MPKQHSSGGKKRMGAISKMGNRDLRSLFWTSGFSGRETCSSPVLATIQWAKLVVAACTLLMRAGCGSSSRAHAYASEASHEPRIRGDFDEDESRDEAAEERSSALLEDLGDLSDCTPDSTGHEAGLEWAKDLTRCPSKRAT